MILIVDDNVERRNNLTIWLRMKGYVVSEIPYEYMDFYTKPILTAYINPQNKMIDSIKNADTISVIFSERKSINLPSWSINVPSLKNIANEIMKIYDEKCPYQKEDKIDIVGYACMKNGEFALGGKILSLSLREKQLLSLFMFNSKKKFNLYDVVNYFVLRSNPETNMLNAIYLLNRKAVKANREKMIIVNKDVCYFNPEIANFVCEEYKEYDDDEDIDRYSEFVYKKFF